MDERPSSDGLEHRARERVRVTERGEAPGESANGEKQDAAIMQALKEAFEEKERQS